MEGCGSLQFLILCQTFRYFGVTRYVIASNYQRFPECHDFRAIHGFHAALEARLENSELAKMAETPYLPPLILSLKRPED